MGKLPLIKAQDLARVLIKMGFEQPRKQRRRAFESRCGLKMSFINFYAILLSMVRKYTVVIEKDEDGWLVSEVVELPGCHTQGKTMDQLIERTKEAIQAYLGSDEAPMISETFVGVQQIEV